MTDKVKMPNCILLGIQHILTLKFEAIIGLQKMSFHYRQTISKLALLQKFPEALTQTII